MTNKRTKAPANKRPALKLPVEELAAPTPDQETPDPIVAPAEAIAMVEPLSPNAFQLIMQIIDNADFKGREAGQVLAVRMELARVANLRATGDGQ